MGRGRRASRGADLVREDSLTTLIDSFFATRIFGADRLAHFDRQSASLSGELHDRDGDKRKRVAGQIAAVEQKIERQLAVIEAGVDPIEVGRRIRDLKAERAEARSVLAQIEGSQRDSTAVDPGTPARSSRPYPTSASDSPPPVPMCGVLYSTPSVSTSRSTATQVRYV